MDIIIYSAVFCSINSFVIFILFLYIYITDKKDYFAVWSAAWMLMIIHYISVALSLSYQDHAYISVVRDISIIMSSYFLAEGAFRFLDVAIPFFSGQLFY